MSADRHNGGVTKTSVQAMTDDPADQQRIAQRYPRRSLGSTLLAGAAILIGAAALVIYLTLGAQQSQRPPVEADLLTHHVVSNTEAGFSLRVARIDPSQPAVCTIQAQAQNYEHVGTSEFEIPPSEHEVSIIEGTLKTVRVADAVYVEGCRLAQ